MDIKRLKALRKAKGYTQQDVANALGFTNQQRYNFYETGKREPDNNTLTQLASLFNVSTDYLLGKTEASKIKKEATSMDIEEALRLFVEGKLGRPANQSELQIVEATTDGLIEQLKKQQK